MPLSSTDQELVAVMKQREFHIKRRQRAADMIHHELRRYRMMMAASVAVVVALVMLGIFVAVESTLPDAWNWWRPTLVVAVIGALLGVFVGQAALRTKRGEKLLARKENQIREKYSTDLHAGRRWLQFYYQGEDISGYIPQILYYIESEGRLDSVDAALALAKSNLRAGDKFAVRAMDRFTSITAQTNLVVISSTDRSGQPSSRLMRFVTSDRPGVWYVAAAPESPKIQELDHGRIAVMTLPTESGSMISSNRVRIRRLETSFLTVAPLYRAQAPDFLEGMSEEEQQHELVYELTLESAKVDSWLEHDVVEFNGREFHVSSDR